MIASLPMYDRPETAAANERLWAGIRDELRLMWQDIPDRAWPLPETLTRDGDPAAHWLAPDLALSQTCGLPYRTRLYGKVTLVGTADHRLPGCPPGHYNSVFVMRADDDRTDPADWPALRFACNAPDSQSGWAAPQAHMQALGLSLGEVLLTGAHRDSALAVAEGRADLAAIDAVSWRMMRRWDDFTGQLQEAARTWPTPALPYITAGGRDADDLGFALSHAIETLAPEDRETLSLHGFITIPAQRYLEVPTPTFPAPGTLTPG